MKVLFIVISFAFSNVLFAGNGSGRIFQVLVHSGGGNGAGVAMFKTETNTNKAACSTLDNGSQWAFSLENEHGRAMYALLLSAQAQRKTIFVVGKGDCTAWGDRERPEYIYLNNSD